MVVSYSYSGTSAIWTESFWNGTAVIDDSVEQHIDVGISDNAPIPSWGQIDGLDYWLGNDRYSYAERDDLIKVDKGAPAKACYAIFYATNKDPVIFCRTKREMRKEVRKLLKREDVDYRSIRIFVLMGGAKVIKKGGKKA